MRIPTLLGAALAALACLAGCKVDDKQAPDDGGGTPPVGDGSDGSTPPDGVNPDTTIDSGPDAFSNASQVTFTFSSNDLSATFECRIDRDTAQPCTSPYSRTLADGSHTFSVRAVNRSGNGDDTPAEKVWTTDTMPPDTTLTDSPPSADNTVMPQFAFRSSEDGATFECSLDNAGYAPCTSGASFGPVGDGPHSFTVRARDRAGNVDPTPVVYAWTVDTRTPDTQIIDGPSGPTASTSASFSFFSPDAGAGATFQCALDGAAFAACTSPQAYGPLPEGAHKFAVRVRDSVGNLDPSPADHSWTVDLTPPDTTISGGPSGTVPVASANFTFTASETGSTFACSVDGGAFGACTSPVALTGLAQGAHTFSVRATDAAGHDDPSPATRAWTVDTVAPEVSITAGPASGSTSGPRVSFAFTISDGSAACSFDSAAFAACASPMATNLAAGAHQFAIRATDGAGNPTTMTRNWTVACSAPDPSGAAGLLHLDDTGQTLANAVAGGAPATLGDTADVEPTDPAPLASARFGGGLTFAAAQSDHVAWPLGLGAMPEVTVELWAKPTASSGARELAVSGDGRIALRVAAASATSVQFSFSVAGDGPGGVTTTATSAALAAGVWHHVLASLQAPSLHLWVDGVRVDAGNVQLGSAPALASIRLGGDAATAYDGALDEVWLAQSAITTDDAALARYCPL